MSRTTIINVSNRLPVTVGDDDKITKSSGGLVAALEGVNAEQYRLKWLGWPGGEIDDPGRRREVERALEHDFGCTPVFLSREEAEGHYEGFSNSSLWPLLHYLPSYFRYEPGWWEHYRAVNRRFADKVLSMAGDDDLVWVHDYQLMLLPAMLKRDRPGLRVGFFLHTPFPSYEIFRFHPRRDELVAGLLGADLLGFHTFGYLRHFRSTVLRLLGLSSEIMTIRHDGGSTALGVYPIGINARKFEEELGRAEFREQLARSAEAYEGKEVILSVERLDYTKGIVRRLNAIDLYLAGSTKEDRERLKFIFISVPSREGVEQYQHLREEIEHYVGRLNGEYATLHNSPIHFIHGSVSFTELCAMYALADVAVVTPLIDGMNLVAKEFVACQRDRSAASGAADGAGSPGVLVLSEFAGAAEELFDALIVNPYDSQAVAGCIRRGLDMPAEERRRRMRPMRERVMRFDAQTWARSFIDDLSAVPVPHGPQSRCDEIRWRIADALASGQKVALFLDYDGTLREIEATPGAASPDAATRAVLDRLLGRPGLDVTIISGRTPADLEAFLGSYPFGLVAEHGASIRRPCDSRWEATDRNVSYAWKEPILKILHLYETSTPGSFIEDKRTGLVWHYRKADPEFGGWKAKNLVSALATVTANEPVFVRHGKKIVEVTAAPINKGAAVARILEECGNDYALVVVAGDDATDETMFTLELPNLLSVHVGEGDTHAQFQVRSPAAFRRLLEEAVGGARATT